jgi:hypothetical protein
MSQILDRAIELLIDGQPVDWEAVLEDAADPHERALIGELRGLAQLDSEEHAFGNLPADGTLGIAAPSAGSAGRRWAHLELQAEIGRGTSGTVYRAWDTRLAREVALKLLTDAGGANIEEARRLARVTHPNVVTVYGVDRVEG